MKNFFSKEDNLLPDKHQQILDKYVSELEQQILDFLVTFDKLISHK
jgi:hypothetical protein